MPLWGKSSADADKPKYLNERDADNTFLEANGWTLTHPNGNKELLVAMSTGTPATDPVNSVAPAITGTATVGETLTVTNGTWSGSPTYTRQWKRDGANISGATGLTYVLVAADSGKTITCVVTATNAGGAVTATSNAVVIA